MFKTIRVKWFLYKENTTEYHPVDKVDMISVFWDSLFLEQLELCTSNLASYFLQARLNGLNQSNMLLNSEVLD